MPPLRTVTVFPAVRSWSVMALRCSTQVVSTRMLAPVSEAVVTAGLLQVPTETTQVQVQVPVLEQTVLVVQKAHKAVLMEIIKW